MRAGGRGHTQGAAGWDFQGLSLLQGGGVGCKSGIIGGHAVLSHAAGLGYVVDRIARPCIVGAGVRRPTT